MNSSGSEQDNPSERSRGQRRDSQGQFAVNISELSDLTGDTPPSEHSSASEEGECGSEIYDASPCPLHRVETAPTPPFPVLKAKPEPATHPRPNVSIPAHGHMHWCTLHHGPGSQSKDSEESISAFHASSGLSDVTVETSATEKVQISPPNEHAINNDILSHCSTASASRSEKPGRFKDIPETTPPPLKGPVIVATFGSRDEVLWSAEDIIPGFPGPGPMSPGDGYLAIDTGERHERVPGVINSFTHRTRHDQKMRERGQWIQMMASNNAREVLEIEKRVAELKRDNNSLQLRISELGHELVAAQNRTTG